MNSILELIPETGIGETALAVAAGLKLTDLRSKLNILIQKRAIEPVPDLPYHYRPVLVKIPDPQEIKDLLAKKRMESFTIAMELGTGAAQTSAILKQMASRGEVFENGDYWELLDANDGFSTGINMPNLHNIIFASPSKSKIRNLQSIGRGLRNAEGKDKAVLYDIADDLRVGKHMNFTLHHFVERVKIYTEEKFKFKVYKIGLKE